MTESAVIEKRPVALGSPLTDLDSAYRLAKNLAMASVMPNDLRGKPSDVLAIMLYGQDLGLSPMQAIQGIYVVKGKPQLASQTWTALARRAGHKVREIESTDKRCTIEITTKDDPEHPHRETYTIDMAVKAGLCTVREDGSVNARSARGEKLPWETSTKTMLRNRAISNGAKLACPEVALGFAIEGDYDYIPEPPEVTTVSVEVVPPQHHGQAVDDKVTEAVLNDEIGQLAQQFDFTADPTGEAGAGEAVDEETVEPEPPDDYECNTCGTTGDHFEDECPKRGGADA